MKNIFNNIGLKIKGIAAGLFAFGISSSILASIITLIVSRDISVILYVIVGAIVGVLTAWISSCMIYGFGEIIDRLCQIAENNSSNNEKNDIENNDEVLSEKILELH